MSRATVTRTSRARTGPQADRGALLLSAALIVGSLAVYVLATVFHPGGIDPNDHRAVFVQYARSAGWTADHLGWFVQTGLLIAGLLVLFHALDPRDGGPGLLARLGTVFAGVALALTAMRDAVDGVVLKRAVDAWLTAPDGEQAARFASAEAARWLEEAVTSYQGFALGLTLLLLAALVVWTVRIPRPVGYLLAVGGAGYLAVGWILGEAGFAPQGAAPTYVAQFFPILAGIWLLISALRMPAHSTGPARLTR